MNSTIELNVTKKMRLALLMISLDKNFICNWQTILRLTEAGYISYEDGRAHITKEGRALLRKPLAKAHPRPISNKSRRTAG